MRNGRRSIGGRAWRRGWREGWVPAVALALLLGDPGCLNPRPEDDPSVTAGVVPGDQPSGPDACSNDPALPECSVPVQGGTGADEPPPLLETDDDLAPTGGAAPALPSEPESGPADAGTSAAAATSDAGIPRDRPDAGAR